MKQTYFLSLALLSVINLQARFLSVDPAREFINPYSYVGNNPISKIDPTGMLERDANGKIKWQPTNIFQRWGDYNDPENIPVVETRMMQKGFATANDGKTQIPLWKLDQGGCGGITDCHGVSFGDSTYWINDQDVDRLLIADGYTKTTTPKVGDVLIYRSDKTYVQTNPQTQKQHVIYPYNGVMHSLTVMEVDAQGQVTKLAGLGGVYTTVKPETEDSGWFLKTAKREYWTRPASEMQGFKEGLHDYDSGRGKVDPDVLQTFKK